MNENENLNNGNLETPKPMDYSFDFSNQVADNTQTTAPEAPASTPVVEPTPAPTLEPVAPVQTAEVAEPMPEVAPVQEQVVPQMPTGTLNTNEVPTPSVEISEVPVEAINQQPEMAPVSEPVVEPVMPEAPIETLEPIAPAQPTEVATPMPEVPVQNVEVASAMPEQQEPQLVDVQVPVENFDNMTNETTVQTEKVSEPETVKSGKNTLVFGAILVVLIALFIIFLPMIRNLG